MEKHASANKKNDKISVVIRRVVAIVCCFLFLLFVVASIGVIYTVKLPLKAFKLMDCLFIVFFQFFPGLCSACAAATMVYNSLENIVLICMKSKAMTKNIVCLFVSIS